MSRGQDLDCLHYYTWGELAWFFFQLFLHRSTLKTTLFTNIIGFMLITEGFIVVNSYWCATAAFLTSKWKKILSRIDCLKYIFNSMFLSKTDLPTFQPQTSWTRSFLIFTEQCLDIQTSVGVTYEIGSVILQGCSPYNSPVDSTSWTACLRVGACVCVCTCVRARASPT